MTDEREQTDETLAAEHALGVLDGDELRQARERWPHRRGFAREVARWRGRLAPMLDEVDAVPSARRCVGADRASASLGSAVERNVVELAGRVALWRGVAAAMTALAASSGARPARRPPVAAAPVATSRPAAPPLVAMLGDTDKNMKVVASWDPASRRLVLAVAGDMPADPSHAHELWVIPPRRQAALARAPWRAASRCTCASPRRWRRLLQQGATIAISVEPPGGSPTGAPTGPVVASGSLGQA